MSARERNAALTAAAFGNRSATSGSMTTTFELARSRSTYFPRTNVPKPERLYSERSSSAASVLAFLIQPSLRPRCGASGDDSNGLVMHGVGHHKQPPRGRHAKRHETPFVGRMIRIVACGRQGIEEHA